MKGNTTSHTRKLLIAFSIVAAALLLTSSTCSVYAESKNRFFEDQAVTTLSNETILSMIAFTIALICYTCGVAFERLEGSLKPWHVKLFWLGFLFEICGAIPMFMKSEKGNFSIHKLVGAVALGLIVMHNVLASLAVRTNMDIVLHLFPKFSTFVYVIWFMAFLTGMIIGIKKSKEQNPNPIA